MWRKAQAQRMWDPVRRPTIEQLRQHPWVNVDYTQAVPRNPVPRDGTNDDLFEPTVKPETLSNVGRPFFPCKSVRYVGGACPYRNNTCYCTSLHPLLHRRVGQPVS